MTTMAFSICSRLLSSSTRTVCPSWTPSLPRGMRTMPSARTKDLVAPAPRGSGVASRLLCFAALYCFCNTLASELTSRNVNIKLLNGRATPTKTKDDYNRTRIKRIFIDVEVDVDDNDLPALAEAREVMAMGSLITYSMNESIEVDQVIRRVGDTGGLF